MVSPKIPKNPKTYSCEKCNYYTGSKKDFNKHLITSKHQMIINGNMKDNVKAPKLYICDCGKQYNFSSGLSRHKQKCNYQHPEQQQTPKEDIQQEDNKDDIIKLLVADNKEMRDMFLMFIKNHAEGQEDMTKKIIQEVLPLIGNDHHNTTNTNSHNNTLNFYLTHTCKDAESITDFTSRFCERIETFFNGNYDKIAHNQLSLADNVQEIFFECMDDKPQPNRFIQTTDKKNGIFYVKEQKKNEENKMVGDAEFVKYKDGFDKHGAKIGHAIHKTLHPCKTACISKLEANTTPKPNEEDYEDYDEYEKAYNQYSNSTGEIKENLMFQTHYAMNLFDNKQIREKTLSETKRTKDM